jgi:hypothetical protein
VRAADAPLPVRRRAAAKSIEAGWLDVISFPFKNLRMAALSNPDRGD